MLREAELHNQLLKPPQSTIPTGTTKPTQSHNWDEEILEATTGRRRNTRPQRGKEATQVTKQKDGQKQECPES